MITCSVVDDEAHAIDVLARYIRQTPGLELAGSFENPLEALEALTTGRLKADLTFLDVDMPQLSGLDLAGLIGAHTRVVFTTAFPSYALQAFDRNALDYMLKPISYERFLQSVNRVRERLAPAPLLPEADREPDTHIFVKGEVKGKLVRIDFDDLVYVEAQQNYVRLHLAEEALTTYLTLAEMAKHLPSNRFTRVHKSFIVNNASVRALEGNEITLSGQRTLPLGSSYREAFLETINAKLVSSKRKG